MIKDVWNKDLKAKPLQHVEECVLEDGALIEGRTVTSGGDANTMEQAWDLSWWLGGTIYKFLVDVNIIIF